MSDLIGQVLVHRYRVDAFLGRGGMSDVYRVWDLQRDVPLAIKILHEDLAQDKVFLRRFRREAQTLAKLQHPNIVRYYGMEQEGRLAFMLMEFVEGHSLRQAIFDSPGPLSNQRILQLMRPICAALNYAHAQGFVHCDVKPANILIERTGRVLVSDFGIARMTEGATATMLGAGTPAYMSPEQVRGENPTPQTDIYALGIMLFEMLSGGERPFTGEHARMTGSTGERIRWEQINLAPPSLRKFNPKIPQELETVVMKCLEKGTNQRYASAQQLISALTQSCAREDKVPEKPWKPDTATPVTRKLSFRPTLAIPRNFGLVGTLLTVLVVLVVLGISLIKDPPTAIPTLGVPVSATQRLPTPIELPTQDPPTAIVLPDTPSATTTETPSPTRPVQIGYCQYTVQPSDTMATILENLGIPYSPEFAAKIQCAPIDGGNGNCLYNPANQAYIIPGWVLVIPGVRSNVCTVNGGVFEP